MKRRRFVGIVRLLPLAPALLPAAFAAGCAREAEHGPVDIKWDRDLDARCGMVISDRRFAAQIRDPAGKVWKFDDIGCAVFWLARQPFDENAARLEYWVADQRTLAWLDARQAHYLAGRKSPMGYQFAAQANAEDGSLSYGEMKQRILARGK
ncbi:MAG TPA: protein NosL [Accumulibacter sp.]|uniref:protein NosL n=1 Tax=Accumulibacter sp. TaxID=2053492 RepID=UPI0028799319|nr:protein NosL [Accumulibacter sp.]MDS4013810.1 protein NosL [Accumulibacter sp.]HNK04295.1 protein NosL [Accumulibacter sp.]